MTHTSPAMSTGELRNFGLIMGGMIALLFGLVLPWLWNSDFSVWPWLIGAIFALWALLAPTTLTAVYRGWMRVAEVLGWINTRIIMGLAFYLIIFPVGALMRLLGKDPLARKFDPALPSYRVTCEKQRPDHMRAPF